MYAVLLLLIWENMRECIILHENKAINLSNFSSCFIQYEVNRHWLFKSKYLDPLYQVYFSYEVDLSLKLLFWLNFY